jgi:flagellar M-ring protein FliF
LGAAALLLVLGGLGFWWWQRRRKAAAAQALAEPPPAPRVFGDFVVPAGEPIDGGDLRPATARDYSGKLDRARTLVTGDKDRAMAVARQMLVAGGGAQPAASPTSAEPAA